MSQKRWTPVVGDLVSLSGSGGVAAWPKATVTAVSKKGCRHREVYLTLEGLGSTTAHATEITIHSS